MSRLAIFVVVLLAVAAGPASDVTPAQTPATAPLEAAAEFPPFDAILLRRQETWLRAQAADRALSQAPDALATLELLLENNRADDALEVLRAILARPGDRFVGAVEVLARRHWPFFEDRTRRFDDPLADVLAVVRTRLAALPRERAASVAFALVRIETELDRSIPWNERLDVFRREYPGTQAARRAELRMLGDLSSAERLAALDAFIRTNPGTALAAEALVDKANIFQNESRPRNPDPTDRFLRLLAVADELENGAYPDEWRARASGLVSFFFDSNAVFAPGNLDRMIAGYERFVRSHFEIDSQVPWGNGVGYLACSRLAELYRLKGDEDGLKRLFATLESAWPDPAAARFLQAVCDANPIVGTVESRAAGMASAKARLRTLAEKGRGLYHRKALATLATFQLFDGEYEAASATYRRYLTAYPQSPWTWAATLRLAQADEARGDWEAALESYHRLGTEFASVPLVPFFASVYAGRVYEATGQFAQALRSYLQALDQWDVHFDLEMSFAAARRGNPDSFAVPPDPGRVTKRQLADRVAELQQSLVRPSGAFLERGRWLIARERWTDALAPLGRAAEMEADGPLAAPIRELQHWARLGRALDLADRERADRDEAAALRELDALAGASADPATAMAGVAFASLLWTRGDRQPARDAMVGALDAWSKSQSFAAAPAPNTLDADVAAIRRLVFQPTGDGIYATQRWSGYTFPSRPPRYLLVSPDIVVIERDGTTTDRREASPFSAHANLLWLSSDRKAWLERILARIGGTRQRQRTAVMELPNQPVGASLDLMRLWNQFFPAAPAHWGGWDLDTFPRLWRLRFHDTTRTRAAAEVAVRHSGATLLLEKVDGVWRVTGLKGFWIT